VELAEGAVGSLPAAPFFAPLPAAIREGHRALSSGWPPADIAGGAAWDNIDGRALLNRVFADHSLHAGAAFGYVERGLVRCAF